MTRRTKIKRALLSVYDKAGLVDLAKGLNDLGVELVSSGNTSAALEAAGIPVTRVEQVTGSPEMLDGRVKTLHPKIHGGLLADLGNEAHRHDLDLHGIRPFDLVVSNLYPFEARPDIETIDIGGPAMTRAAAKNHAWVTIVTSPDQYPALLTELHANDGTVGDEGVLREIAIGDLLPGKYQPRSRMDKEALEGLAQSIQNRGIVQPILVRELRSGKFEIVAGERRWRAAQIAGLTTVPALVREIADEHALGIGLIENIQREDLNAIEEAAGIKRLIEEFHLTHDAAAQAVGRSRVAVTNLLRLLDLAKPVQDMVMDAKLDMGHGRALLALSKSKQVEVAHRIVAKALSVRDTERMVKHELLPQRSGTTWSKPPLTAFWA